MKIHAWISWPIAIFKSKLGHLLIVWVTFGSIWMLKNKVITEAAKVIIRPTGRNLVRAKLFTRSQLSKISSYLSCFLFPLKKFSQIVKSNKSLPGYMGLQMSPPTWESSCMFTSAVSGNDILLFCEDWVRLFLGRF